MQTNTAPGWVQILSGLGVGAIAACALKVDIVNNYEYGRGISAELATVMVLAAVCVAALPAIAAIFGWSHLLRALTALCVLMTCWSAINAYAEKMGAEILNRTAEQAQYASAEQDQAAARATLARIIETADTQTLERLVADARATADAAELGDTKKMGSPSCYKPCREAKANLATALSRLAEAKARDAAKAELATAKDEAKAGPAEASMVATWIAARTGRDAADIARTIALAMTVLGIIVTQGVALLAHMAALLIGSGLKTLGGGKPQAPETAPEPARRSRQAISELDAFEHMQRRMRASPGRIYRGSANKMAEELGLARSTFASWVKRWVEEGKIDTAKSGRLTAFSFAKVRRVA